MSKKMVMVRFRLVGHGDAYVERKNWWGWGSYDYGILSALRNSIEEDLNKLGEKADSLMLKLEEVNKKQHQKVEDLGLTIDVNGGRSDWDEMPLEQVKKFERKGPRPPPDWRDIFSHEQLRDYGLGKVPEKDKYYLPGNRKSGNSNKGIPTPDLRGLSGKGVVFTGHNASKAEKDMIRGDFSGSVRTLDGMPKDRPHQNQGKKNKQQHKKPEAIKPLDLD